MPASPNLDKAIASAIKRMEVLVKAEITRQKLVDSGQLLRSVKFRFKMTPEGPMLQLEAEDYFKFLDSDYGIMKNVYKTVDFKNIIKEIGAAVAKDAVSDILGK